MVFHSILLSLKSKLNPFKIDFLSIQVPVWETGTQVIAEFDYEAKDDDVGLSTLCITHNLKIKLNKNII